MSTTFKATSFRDATHEEWEIAATQGKARYVDEAGKALLDMLRAQKDENRLAWGINNYEHSLQCATRALRDGKDEEYIFAALFHDIAQNVYPFAHDKISAAMLRPYLNDRNYWIIENHQVFQVSFRVNSKFDTTAVEKFRGHPYFEDTMEFCEHYDQNCFDPNYDWLPLATFEPMVRRVCLKPIERFITSVPY